MIFTGSYCKVSFLLNEADLCTEHFFIYVMIYFEFDRIDGAVEYRLFWSLSYITRFESFDFTADNNEN